MFIKKCKSIKNGKSYYHYQIAHSYRDNGKIKHKTIANLPHLSESDISSLIRGLQKLQASPLTLKQAELHCKKIIDFAPIEVLNHIWDTLEISTIIRQALQNSGALVKIKFDLIPYIKLLTFFRLLNPGSELKLSKWFLNIYFPELKVLEYHKLLRSLGYVMRIKNEIETLLFEKQKDLFHLDVDLVFYDITSTYFEAQGPPIAKKGYSRDHRKDRNQVVIALAITKDGFPIGHEVLEGNMADKNTVMNMIDILKSRFKIDRCIFVGDRGMISKKNLQYLEEKGYKYIFALRRRRLIESREIIEKDPGKYSGYRYTDIDDKDRFIHYFEVCGEKKKYIVCHNAERALTDLEKLEKKIKKINEQIEKINKTKQPSDKIIKRFCRIYDIGRFYNYGLNKKGNFYYKFKNEAYEYEKLIAGKYILKTNEISLKAEEIIIAYKNLARIECSFKDMKDFLLIRPIFHQNQENILGHIFVTVLAYMLERVLERYFEEEGKNRITAKRALNNLSEIKLVVNELEGRIFGTITEKTKEVEAIMKKLGIKNFTKTYYLEKKEVRLPPKAKEKLAKYDICSR